MFFIFPPVTPFWPAQTYPQFLWISLCTSAPQARKPTIHKHFFDLPK
jgi:hypothetical protein